MTITWPTDTTQVIDEIRVAIGRPVVFHIVVTGETNPNASDPVTGLAINSFSGSKWVPSTLDVTVTGHVRWRGAEQKQYLPGGYLIDGDCSVTVAYADVSSLDLSRIKTMVVDGKTLVVRRLAYKGVQNINRVNFTLEER